jgi:hypothetical protein
MTSKADNDFVFDLLGEIFGESSVDQYDKNTMHIWQDGSLVIRVKNNKTKWTVSFSAGLSPFLIAQAAATLTYHFDFVVVTPFLRLADGTILEGEAAMVYASQNIELLWFGRKLGTVMPMETRDETSENIVLSNRFTRVLN